MVAATIDGSYEHWHQLARALLVRGVPPHDVEWRDERNAQLPLTQTEAESIPARATGRATVKVPRAFVARAQLAACHRNAQRWALLYRLLWRITHGERDVLENPLDGDVTALERMVQHVRRDEHKMHAFVRFRKVTDADGDRYIAFHRPDHFIVRLAAPFFIQRFRSMRWSILTPDECAHWDGTALTFSPGVDISAAPGDDEIEEVWRTYYAATFNPARVNPRAMIRELPARHWPTLPEARAIPALLATAPSQVEQMLTRQNPTTSARLFVPRELASVTQLREAAASCQGCPLYESATQVVFGEGLASARLMLVGEQPGDEEDRCGKPFVGPAGQVLSDAITRAGLRRDELYITNAVKHFTFRREGKRRIHERPRVSDVRACRPWLEAEIHLVAPSVIVCLGSTAAQALLGPQVRIQRDRGRAITSHWAPVVIPTYHPSAVLRAGDPVHSREIFDSLIADLRLAADRSHTAVR